LKAISEPYRTTVILRDIEELSYEEIARVTATSLGTVKSRLVRGREALRKRLERHLSAFGMDPAVSRVKPRRKGGPLGSQKVEVMP
jgi:RNA polymerase sigma-70 factor (ECF subfamily)